MDRNEGDLCLHQAFPLSLNVFKEAHDVDGALILDLRQHAVQHNVCARAANTSTARQREY